MGEIVLMGRSSPGEGQEWEKRGRRIEMEEER